MTVWREKPAGVWTTSEFPGYEIRHRFGSAHYEVWSQTWGTLAHPAKFARAEELVKLDIQRIAEAAPEEPATVPPQETLDDYIEAWGDRAIFGKRLNADGELEDI